MVTKRVERVYGDDGTLTPDGIERLVRRVWWGEYDEVRDREGWRVKWTHLRLWWAVEKWPAWWPIAKACAASCAHSTSTSSKGRLTSSPRV